MAATRALFWLALVVWVGAVVFFSFVVTPGIFATLPRESAGQVVGVLFPRYYRVGAAAGVIALVAAALLWRGVAPSVTWAGVTAMIALMLAATLYAGWVIQPRAQALRPALHAAEVDPQVHAEFDRLHGRAVALNGAVLLLGLTTICVAAASLQLGRR